MNYRDLDQEGYNQDYPSGRNNGDRRLRGNNPRQSNGSGGYQNRDDQLEATHDTRRG